MPYLNEIVMEKSRALRTGALWCSWKLGLATFRDLVEEIDSVVDEKQLEGLVRSAGTCRDLAEFRLGHDAGLTEVRCRRSEAGSLTSDYQCLPSMGPVRTGLRIVGKQVNFSPCTCQ